MSRGYHYTSAAERRARLAKQKKKLRKKGLDLQPVEIEGKKIAHSFWGKSWCKHLESFSDYENRLPRGRTYVRNGSVCHLLIQAGRVEARVSGSSLYNVSIDIKTLEPETWDRIKARCVGQVGSMIELLQGKLSEAVMAVVTDQDEGLFPNPDEISFSCSCPDSAMMCKHVAAALYGVGNRLDASPELLFLLRGADAAELIGAEMALPVAAEGDGSQIIDDERLSAIFGIELGEDITTTPPVKTEPTGKPGDEVEFCSGTPDSSESSLSPELTGEFVARLREELRLSVSEFAEAIGVSGASVRRWESTRGRLRLKARCLEALVALREKAKPTMD